MLAPHRSMLMASCAGVVGARIDPLVRTPKDANGLQHRGGRSGAAGQDRAYS